MTDEKPEGYIYKAVPKTAKQAAAEAAETRITQTIKSGLQHYLEQYFSATGKYRSQLKNTAPYSIQYEKRVSAPLDAQDPTIIDLQLGKLWKETRMALPCILIIDQSFEYRISGLGGIGFSHFISRHTSQVTIPIDVTSTILLEIAAMDETTCGDLRDILVYIFGPLTIHNKSHVIYGPRPQDRWEIRLPQALELQGLERRNISDDQKDSFWTSGISLNLEFEGHPEFAFDNQTERIRYDGAATENPGYSVERTHIAVPERVYLRHPAQISYDAIPARSGLVSDNPNILVVDEFGVIHPKRIGKCKIHLMDYQSGAKSSKSWEVEVVPN